MVAEPKSNLVLYLLYKSGFLFQLLKISTRQHMFLLSSKSLFLIFVSFFFIFYSLLLCKGFIFFLKSYGYLSFLSFTFYFYFVCLHLQISTEIQKSWFRKMKFFLLYQLFSFKFFFHRSKLSVLSYL